MRVIRVSRPGIFSGSSRSQSSSTCSEVALGPSLTPTGLFTPEKNSTWAPSGWRVRSPIQSMCAEQSYQSPVSESRRAVSYTHLRAHETRHELVCRLLLEKKKK